MWLIFTVELTGVCGLWLLCDKVLIAARGLGYPVPCTFVLLNRPTKRLCPLDGLLGLDDHSDKVISCIKFALAIFYSRLNASLTFSVVGNAVIIGQLDYKVCVF